jgi:hypothetical protein
MTDVEFVGPWDATIQGLENAEGLFLPLASQAIAVCLEAVKEEIQPTPEQPSRTRAKTFNTYVRDTGNFPRSAFKSSAGTPGGYKVVGKNALKKAGRVRYTSQHSSKRFRMTVTVTEDAVIGNLHNFASYSGYLWGPESGTPHQVAFHHETGWVSTDQALRAAQPQMEDALQTAIDQFVTVLKGGG